MELVSMMMLPLVFMVLVGAAFIFKVLAADVGV